MQIARRCLVSRAGALHGRNQFRYECKKPGWSFFSHVLKSSGGAAGRYALKESATSNRHLPEPIAGGMTEGSRKNGGKVLA